MEQTTIKKSSKAFIVATIAVALVAMAIVTALDAGMNAYAKTTKGTKGYYTIKGHHHCFKGTPGCTLHGLPPAKAAIAEKKENKK